MMLKRIQEECEKKTAQWDTGGKGGGLTASKQIQQFLSITDIYAFSQDI